MRNINLKGYTISSEKKKKKKRCWTSSTKQNRICLKRKSAFKKILLCKNLRCKFLFAYNSTTLFYSFIQFSMVRSVIIYSFYKQIHWNFINIWPLNISSYFVPMVESRWEIKDNNLYYFQSWTETEHKQYIKHPHQQIIKL